MARRKDYLVRSLIASLALHAALLSLQFGAPGLGLPWPSLEWNERKASVPRMQAVLRAQPATAVPQQNISPAVAEEPHPPTPAKPRPQPHKQPPPVEAAPSAVPDQAATMRASLEPKKVSSPPVVKAKVKRRKKIRVSPVMSTEAEAPWSIRAAEVEQELENKSKEDKSAREAAMAAEARKQKKISEELEEQKQLAKAEEAKRQEDLDRANHIRAEEEAREKKKIEALTAARVAARVAAELAEEKKLEEQTALAKAQEAAQEKARQEAVQRAAEEKRKEEQNALARAELEAQKRQRAEEQARAAALKAAEETQERKRLEALAAARLAEEKRTEEQAAMIRAQEAALEKKRLEAMERAAEEKRKEEQLAAVKTKEEALEKTRAEALARAAEEKRKEEQAALARAEALAKAAQAEARNREQMEAAANKVNAQTAPAQLTSAAERGAGNSSGSTKPGTGKSGGTGLKGGDLASRALDMARSGLSGLPVKVPFDTAPSRRGSILGRNPSDIQLLFYGDSWTQKVERRASENYPKLPKNLLYGPLVISVSVNSDGTLAGVRILKSSGSRELDNAARHIVEISAPFSAFPPDLKRSYDVVDITRTMSFPEKPPVIFGQ